MNAANTRPAPRPASGPRRRDPDATTRFEEVHAIQLRLVGTAFLRVRPLVVAPIAIINGVLLAASGAGDRQRLALGLGLGSAVALFVGERWLLARRTVSARWLAGSLALTTLVLAFGCACSGGIASPLLPLLVAPVVVAAAAFGRGAVTVASFAWSSVVVAVLALAPPL